MNYPGSDLTQTRSWRPEHLKEQRSNDLDITLPLYCNCCPLYFLNSFFEIRTLIIQQICFFFVVIFMWPIREGGRIEIWCNKNIDESHKDIYIYIFKRIFILYIYLSLVEHILSCHRRQYCLACSCTQYSFLTEDNSNTWNHCLGEYLSLRMSFSYCWNKKFLLAVGWC